MAFCWAVEPSEFKVPLEHTGFAGADDDAAAELLPAAADVVEPPADLLPPELEHAVKTMALASTAAIRPAV